MKKLGMGMGVAALALAAALQLGAVGTHFWRSAGYAELSRGHLAGVSLSPEGRLSLAPRLSEVFRTGQALIWTMAADGGGNVYLATGHRGEIFRLTPAMLRGAAAPTPEAATLPAPQAALFFTAPEPEIFALAPGPDGALYAATSPDGKIYRITADGKSSVYFDPHAKYIWALAFSGPTLYVGTGENGEIYRVTAAGEGAKFLDTEQRQVMTLATEKNGDLLAGTDPGGLVYRIQPDGKAFVLYHSDLAEIHALRVAPSGDIYVAAQGERTLPRPGPNFPSVDQSAPPRTTMAVTVTVAGDSERNPPPMPTPDAAPSAPAPMVLTDTPEAVASGAPLSAIYRIAPDGGVDTLWDSRGENADDVLPTAASEPSLLIATDDQGRIYDLDAHQQATVLAQTAQAEATKLLRLGNEVFATTRDFGNLYRMTTTPADSGTYESPVRDTGALSRWGDLTWSGGGGAGAVEISTRSGNSALPDFTWSGWSEPYTRSGTRIASPSARYIQWKAVLHGAAGGTGTIEQTAQLDQVVIPYLPANQAPEITGVRAETVAATGGDAGMNGGAAGLNSAAGGFSSAAGGAATERGIQLSWTAHDPDGDALTYRVYFKGEGESAWKLLRADLDSPRLAVTPAMLPDGSYTFKVVASDADANPAGEAKEAEMASAPATLDSTPPTVRMESATSPGVGAAVAHFSAQDAAPLARAEFAVDGGSWQSLLSDDGIIDSPQEQFTVRAQGLSAGEHVMLLRATDVGGNQGLGKAVVTVH